MRYNNYTKETNFHLLKSIKFSLLNNDPTNQIKHNDCQFDNMLMKALSINKPAKGNAAQDLNKL